MQIRIYRCTDYELKRKIRSITEDIMPKLVKNKKLLDNLKLFIRIDNELTSREKAWGLMYWTDNRYNPRRYVIALNDTQSPSSLVKTLIHELVHVKQYLKGELKDYASGRVKWKNRNYLPNPEDPDFFYSPWENEAYSLSTKYFKINNLQ